MTDLAEVLPGTAERTSAPRLWGQDALWMGRAIKERLNDTVPALRLVLLADDIDPDEREPKQTPAAVVLLDSMRPVDANPLREIVKVEDTWLVILAVRKPRRESATHTEAAGPLIAAVVKSLHGWRPAGALRGLAWTQAPRPSYGAVSYFPLMFTHQAATA
jgi:hypothetical protein